MTYGHTFQEEHTLIRSHCCATPPAFKHSQPTMVTPRDPAPLLKHLLLQKCHPHNEASESSSSNPAHTQLRDGAAHTPHHPSVIAVSGHQVMALPCVFVLPPPALSASSCCPELEGSGQWSWVSGLEAGGGGSVRVCWPTCYQRV